MTDIFVTGNSEDTEMEKLIKNRLARNYTVTYINHDSFTESGKGYNLIVMDSRSPLINARGGVLLMKEDGDVPKELPADITAIINADNKTQLESAMQQGIRTITCGLGTTATISFSSETEEKLTVSLNRGITALSGKNIEPLEIPIEKEQFGKYSLMSFAALRLLLDDFDSELGKLI